MLRNVYLEISSLRHEDFFLFFLHTDLCSAILTYVRVLLGRLLRRFDDHGSFMPTSGVHPVDRSQSKEAADARTLSSLRETRLACRLCWGAIFRIVS
nr:hypothetical protein CFP56_57697 [Quercus suber]